MKRTLFDDEIIANVTKEDKPLNRLKNLDEKIAGAVGKVKAMKEEKILLERKIKELEARLDEKNEEVERLSSEKAVIKGQLEELLRELETLDVG